MSKGARNDQCYNKTYCPDKLRLDHVLFCYILAGAGIYVTNSQLSYSSSSLPNNSIITSYTGFYSFYSSRTRMGFYCCSNSTTSGRTGTFIGINGNSYSGTINVERHGSSHSYAGCMRLYLQKNSYSTSQYYFSSSEEGIYTCRMPDSAGRSIDVSVGLYRDGYGSKFIVHIQILLLFNLQV